MKKTIIEEYNDAGKLIKKTIIEEDTTNPNGLYNPYSPYNPLIKPTITNTSDVISIDKNRLLDGTITYDNGCPKFNPKGE